MKSLFKVGVLLGLFFVSAFSNITLSSKNTFYENEAFIINYEVSAQEIVFPSIKNIASYDVRNTSKQSSYSNINGTVTKKQVRQFLIYPQNDFIIPSFAFVLDGKTVYSKEKKITKEKVVKTKNNNFDLSIKVSKKDLYVGEDTLLTLIFKYRKNSQILDSSLETPRFDNFWFKQLSSSKQYEEGSYIVQEIPFLLFPQKVGQIIIPALKVNLQILDSNNTLSLFSNASKKLNIYSNSLSLDVKALPKDITLIGDFSISSSINKNKLKANEALSYQVKIEGYGNIDDLEDITFNIKNTTVFENKADVKKEFLAGKYYVSYTKTFSFLSNEDFVIPPYTLRYFDKNTKTIKEIKTKAFNVYVEKIKNKSILEKVTIIKKNKNQKTENLILEKAVFFFLGMMSVVLIFCLYKLVTIKNKKTTESSLYKKIKNASSKKLLLNSLAVYILKFPLLDEYIYQLEKCDENDYEDIKKDILILIKKLEKKGEV